MQKSILVAACAALLLADSADAQVQLPPNQTLPQGTTPQLRLPAPCRVDLAITSITLYKLSTPGSVRVEYDVVNLGPSEWNSRAGQQFANLTTHNNAGGRADYTLSVPFGARRIARNERAARVVSTPIANAFDAHEFAGTVHAYLSFDPDIALDGNACNDDTNAANNEFRLSTEQVWGFLSSRARSQTFRR